MVTEPKRPRGNPKGRPRGGRVKGTPNKRSLDIRKIVEGFCLAEGIDNVFDPAIVIVDQIMKEKAKEEPDPEKLVSWSKSLLPYYHPARKAIEIEPSDSELPVLVIKLTDDGSETGKNG